MISEGAKIHAIKPALEDRGGILLTYSQQLGYIVNALIKGRQIIRRNGIDIIHANTYTPVIPAVVLGKTFNIPVISTIHHVVLGQWKLWSSQQGVRGSTSFIGPIYEKIILRLPVERVHVVSHTTEEELMRFNPKAKVTTINNGIDVEDNSSTEFEYQEFILYIGRLAITKNLGVVILAFRDVVQTFPDARLIIVGDGGMRKEWEHLVNENKLERNIVFMGHVSQEIKQGLLSSCAALVLPSILEGFGRVIIEAFSMNKPVLVSNIKALTEVVDNGVDGFLISPNDVANWTEKINFLLSNREVCRVMGANGRNKVKDKFNLTLISDKIEELYKEITSHKKNTSRRLAKY